MMPPLILVPFLFILFYFLPGAVLLSNSGARWRQFETISLAFLLSLIFAPFTFIILSWVAPGSDRIQLISYMLLWAIAAALLRGFRRQTSRWLPEFNALPRADFAAWLISAILAAVVVLVRLRIFHGYYSPVDDDPHHLTRVTSIATTGLPTLLSRQPFYSFVFYDLNFIAPGLLVRYTGGEIGVSLAWVMHAGANAFAVSIFLTRLMYMYAGGWKARTFGLVSLHLATGFDLVFLPWMGENPFLDTWQFASQIFFPPFAYLMPISNYIWIPQHMLGLAVAGLICFIILNETDARGPSPHLGGSILWNEGLPRAVAVAILMAALLRTSVFVFLGVLPGLAIWHLRELLKDGERRRTLFNHSVTAFIVFVLSLSFLLEISQKSIPVEFGLRHLAFLEDTRLSWLSPILAVPVVLALEIGLLLPLLLYLLKQSHLHSRPVRLWLFMSAGLLIPFLVLQHPDIGTRGVIPATLAATILVSYLIETWDRRKGIFVTGLVTIQVILSIVSAGSEVYFRNAKATQAIPPSTRWIAENTPLDSLVFYELVPEKYSFLEVNYGGRMSYNRSPHGADLQYTIVPNEWWACLPEADLYAADSLCSIEAQIPGAQSVFVKYNAPEPLLSPAFVREFSAESKSVYSLSCPDVGGTRFPNRRVSSTDPFQQYHLLLTEVPLSHGVAASTHDLSRWLQSEAGLETVYEVSPSGRDSNMSLQQHLRRQLASIEEGAGPVWFLLDGMSDSKSVIEMHTWNEMVYKYLQKSYFVTQPASGSEWLLCQQRVVLALPPADVVLESALSILAFEGGITVSEMSLAPGPHSPGDVVPIQLEWRKSSDDDLKFFVHFLDEAGTVRAQIDPFAVDDGTGQPQRTRLGIYLTPDLPVGKYEIRFGVYRANDGQRLTLPSGEDSVSIPLTLRK